MRDDERTPSSESSEEEVRLRGPGESELPPGPLPRHIAIIMDGNGRWAEERGLPRLAGHAAGTKSVRATVTECAELGVRALTLYAFSAQNWARPSAEVEGLMELLFDYLARERDTLLENGIRLAAVGELTRLPERVQARLAELRAATAGGASMVLTLALSYGGREEIVEMTRAVARAVEAGALRPDAIDEAVVDRHLSTAGLPPVDLLVRTSGELRLSNFLLWQSAYAELYFTDVAWPDFDRSELYRAIVAYRARQRRFGKTGAQLAGP